MQLAASERKVPELFVWFNWFTSFVQAIGPMYFVYIAGIRKRLVSNPAIFAWAMISPDAAASSCQKEISESYLFKLNLFLPGLRYWP